MRDGEGEGDGAYQDAQDDEEGGYGTDFKSEEFVANHFDTDESLLMHIQCGLLDHDLPLPENTLDDASIAVLIRKASKK